MNNETAYRVLTKNFTRRNSREYGYFAEPKDDADFDRLTKLAQELAKALEYRSIGVVTPNPPYSIHVWHRIGENVKYFYTML